jgi:hypothetical protein
MPKQKPNPSTAAFGVNALLIDFFRKKFILSHVTEAESEIAIFTPEECRHFRYFKRMYSGPLLVNLSEEEAQWTGLQTLGKGPPADSPVADLQLKLVRKVDGTGKNPHEYRPGENYIVSAGTRDERRFLCNSLAGLGNFKPNT